MVSVIQSFQVAAGPIYRAEKPIRNPLYTRWIKRFPCVLCGGTRKVDPMHTGPHGMGQKACDMKVLPGCRKCHDAFDADPRGFAGERGLDIESWIAFFNHAWRLKTERNAR
jgi:hypothetical protein